jgi:phosphonopyruvate decarboxylase
MVNQQLLINHLKSSKIDFITGVPDTLLNDFCLCVENEWDKENHIIAANEGNAIGLAAGYHMGSDTIPLVYMQNSGVGNTLNPLASLTNKEVYSIPMILLIGWRGDPSENDWPQHQKQGELTTVILDDLDIPYKIPKDDLDDVLSSFDWAIKNAKENNSPVAIIAKKGVFEKGEKEDVSLQPSIYSLTRESAMESVVNILPKEAVCLATTGRAARELHAIREFNDMSHDRDFLNVGAMGHTSSIAVGISVAKPNIPVVCFDGDSGAIMHLGSFTTHGLIKPKNFLHIILNNGVHESVGGQPSAGFSASLTEIARSSGYTIIDGPVKTKEELEMAVKKALKNPGVNFIEVFIRKGMRIDMPKLVVNHKALKNKLMESLKL